jgi:hypothetical protein
MLIGGWSPKRIEPTVELYNYETGEQCFLPEMLVGNDQGQAAWLDDTAILCGGEYVYGAVTTNCTIFSQSSNTWIEVNTIFIGNTVKPVHKGHPWDPKIEAVVDRWLFRSRVYYKN